MSDNVKDKKELISHNIDNNLRLAIDPDNLFWGLTKGEKDTDSMPSGEIISLYDKVKNRLDRDMEDFRFSSNLTAIYIDPTDRCNAGCPYCYIPAGIRKNGTQMDKRELEYVLTEIADHFKNREMDSKSRPVIVFHASEPLLVKEIIFQAIKDFEDQFYFGIQTNGLLLEKGDVQFLIDHRIGVGISLDSFDPEINNIQRPSIKTNGQTNGNGNFKKAVEAIEWFDGYEGLNVITTITKYNVNNLPELVGFLHSKKVGCVLLNPVRLTTEASRDLRPDETLLTRYFIEAVEESLELSQSSCQRIIIGNFANIVLGITAPTARRLMCDISPCGGGRCFLTITASGNMIPCGEFIGLNEFSGGNIFNSKISDAMESEPFKKIRSRIVEKIDECDVCEFRNICGAPCPAELHSMGNMYEKSVFCEFYKEIIRYAFRLISEDKVKYLLREESIKNLEYEYELNS
ncbi:MAG: peptide-modifying radical SAM enzyme CbpB [Nitrospirota bacterium]